MDSTTTSSLVKLVSPSLRDAKSGTLWLWVRSQATAESFPFFSVFLDVAVARRATFFPLFSSSPSSSVPYASLPLFSLFRLRLCPAVAADRFRHASPRPLRAPLLLLPSPLPLRPMPCCPTVLTVLHNFFLFSRLPHTNMRPLPVYLPYLVTPLLTSFPCTARAHSPSSLLLLPRARASASSSPCSYQFQLTSPLPSPEPLPSLISPLWFSFVYVYALYH